MAAIPLMLLEEDVERGGKEQSEHEIQDDFAYRNNVHNADIKIRMGNCIVQEFSIDICYSKVTFVKIFVRYS